MKLRTLALVCLGGAVIGLLALATYGYHSWRTVTADLRELQRATALHQRTIHTGVGLDYATLLRNDPRVLSQIATDAEQLAAMLASLNHAAARLGAAHLGEIAHMAEILAANELPPDSWPAITAQLRIHQSAAMEALEQIFEQGYKRIVQALSQALALLLVGTIALAALVVLTFAIIRQRLSGPLRIIENGIKAMTAGDLDARIVLSRDDELGELAMAFNRMATQRQQHEAALRDSEERFRQLAEHIDDVFWMIDPVTHRGIYVSPAYERIWGRPCQDLHQQSGQWFEAIHEADRPRIAAAMQDETTGRYREEYRIVRPDGSIRWVFDRAFPIRDANGKIYRLAGVAQDITERKALEEQLRRAQRLESIGQLTGGIAHDFNNLLTVILGNAELLQEELADNPRLCPIIDMLVGGAQRGAELTHRLLAFARKQALEPKAVDVNRLVTTMDRMLRRTLGEQIEIELVRGAGLWPALVDPGQLENALLNLALNARDAMPGGGRLTIETANVRIDQDYAERHADVQPGQYVLVAVSDTGDGIPPERLERVFEPFYTTKAAGKGTGLGLSMVYGFVKQSGGHINIYSEPDQGTTIRMYLPRPTGTPARHDEAAPDPPGTGGRETILLVEDDELVRRYAEGQLKSLGYRVLTAANGPAALELVHRHPEIDLLFTDIVMPGGMNGRDLAEAARAIRPDLKVLYTSGYTENAIVHHGRLDSGVQLLSKPYRRAELAQGIRRILTDERGAP